MTSHFRVAIAATFSILFGFTGIADAQPTHGLSAFGDLKYPADFAHFDYVNPDAPKGGTLALTPDRLPSSAFDSLNAFILSGEAPQGIDESEPQSMRVFDSLMVRAYDEPDAVYGLIAESAEVAADKTSVVFRLRKEARWHDGSPITADDVVFTFDMFKNEGHPRLSIRLRDVVSAEALDTYIVKFDFRPDGALRDLPMKVAQLPILSKAYYETHDFMKPTLDPPLTSGPYTFGKIDAPRSVTYQRVPDYWAKDLPVNKGRFNFDSVRFEYFRDRTAALEGFLAGAYDLREEFTSKSWATEYKGRNVEAGLIVRDTLPDNRPSGAQAFFINLRRDKFKDMRVRQALDYAFDYEWTNRAIFYGAYARTNSMYINSTLAPAGLPSDAELALLEPWRGKIPDAVFGMPYEPPKSDGSGEDRTNLRKAVMLLRDAGWVAKNGVLVDKAGAPLTIEFLTFDPSSNRVILPYVDALRRIGIQAEIRMVDSAQFQRRIEEFDFDITALRRVMKLTPGIEQRNLWSSQAADIDGSDNIGGVADAAVDSLVDTIINAKDRPSLVAAVHALDRIIMHSHYTVPQWNKGSHTLAWWDKFAWPETKPAFARGVVDLWWVDPDRKAALDAAREANR